jgi:hypothetical protein
MLFQCLGMCFNVWELKSDQTENDQTENDQTESARLKSDRTEK